jgi:hypothetical protein
MHWKAPDKRRDMTSRNDISLEHFLEKNDVGTKLLDALLRFNGLEESATESRV